jgi:hypothetical protein
MLTKTWLKIVMPIWAVIIAVTIIFVLANIPPKRAVAQVGVCAKSDVAAPLEIVWTYTPANQEGFEVERKLNQGAYSRLGGLLGPAIMRHMDTSLVQGTIDNTYTYRVRATNSKSGPSPWSNEFCATVAKIEPVPPAPTNLTGTFK